MSLVTLKIHDTHLIHNYNILRNKTPLLGAVVKANGYGLGAIYVTQKLYQQGCTIFFVASATEGKTLREHFNDIDIYVLDGFIEQQIILDYRLKPVLNTIEQLSEFCALSNHYGAILHIDTGMNRLGVPFSELYSINTADIFTDKIDYVMTHFSDCETNAAFTKHQTDLLLQACDFLGLDKISVANSGGILWHDLAIDKICLGRAGIALYGGINSDNLRAVVSVSGQILQKKYVPQHTPIGYGGTYVTKKPSLLFTVSGGYADGIMRALSGSGFCGWCDGYLLPLLGRVSMDSCIFNATHLPEQIAKSAMYVEFFGLNNPLEYIAECAKTITYEVLTNLSHRANRIIGL